MSDRWKPIAESLPDDDLTVLVALDDGYVWPAFMDGEQWHYVTADPIEDVKVTHWMNMPEPPREIDGNR